jgi:uridine phosphorylase
MARIQETDLILNEDGSTYHLSLLPKHITDVIIAVGDPSRVYRISQKFDDIEFEMNKREFITHVGKFRNRRIAVMSTGIGTDNIELFMTELDALVNVDLAAREPKSRKRRLKIIRIGTSGALQADIPLGAHLVTDYAIGLDGLMAYYNLQMSDFEKFIAEDIGNKVDLPVVPYVVQGSQTLKQLIGFDMVPGNTITTPGFFAPQGRQIRVPIKFKSLLKEMSLYHETVSNFWVTNFEMETAGYYAMARLMGHEVLSVNAIIANRIKNKFSKDPNKIVDALIEKVLNRIAN